jgi:CDP-paratose 2-epimerase
MIEAIDLCEQITGRELAWSYDARHRVGDHIWWIGDLTAFRRDYPARRLRFDVPAILRDIHEGNADRWALAEDIV